MRLFSRTLMLIGLLLSAATGNVAAVEIPEKFGTSPAPYLVIFDQAPVATYKGDIEEFKATNPRINGKRKIDPKSSEVIAYVNFLKQQQQSKVARIAQNLGRTIESSYQMQHALNAVLLELSHAEALSVQTMDGVRFVESYKEYPLLTNDGPIWIGAEGLWNGSEAPDGIAVQGEGMVLGIIDSGINSLHESVADTDPVDGYVHINPLGSGNYLGACDPNNSVQFDASFACNDKLIGAYDFLNPLGQPAPPDSDPDAPEDDNSHGTHVATTAGGNRNDNSGLQIQGVAPRANIIAYDACYTRASDGRGLCPFVSTAASVDQAIADGIVDAINYSIGGGNAPWSEATALAFLSAVESGIFVAASAGNSGPGAGTVGHLEPWVLAVAASTDNALVIQEQSTSVTGPGSVPGNLENMDSTEGSSPVRVPTEGFSGLLGFYDLNSLGCTSTGGIPGGTFTDQIALIERGDCSFAEKSDNASAAGAVAMIVYDNGGGVVTMAGLEAATIPSVMINTSDGAAVENWVINNPLTATAFISSISASEQPTTPDVIVNFSSRGASSLGNLKPEIAAPGSNVFAAIARLSPQNTETFGSISGTSMASPHVAGSAILVLQSNPDWTVTEVKSALMSTSVVDGVTVQTDGSDATWFDMGAGRVDVAAAANAGLVLDETVANFEAANPAIGGDINSLNLAALSTNSCGGDSCTWNRTVRNARDFGTSWSVSGSGDGFTVSIDPSSFELLPGDVIFRDSVEDGNGPNSSFQQLEIVASGIPTGSPFRFGVLEISETGNQTPDQHFPVVVRQ